LFHRERNNTHLSELGLMMRPYLESVEASSRAAKEAAQAAKKLENVVLTLGAMCTIGPQLVCNLLAMFQRDHPDVEVHVIDGEARAMIESLEKGDLHIALVGVPEEMPEQFHLLPVFSERFVVVVGRDHPWAMRNSPVRVAELDAQPYVGRSDCEVYQAVRDDFMKRGVCMRKVFSSPRDEWVQNMVKAGLGIGFFPEFTVTDPDLVAIPLIDPSYSRTIYLATVRGRPHSPAIGAFVKAARHHAWPASSAAQD
jgi:DNA-binding transcriptional LysR family regulator